MLFADAAGVDLLWAGQVATASPPPPRSAPPAPPPSPPPPASVDQLGSLQRNGAVRFRCGDKHHPTSMTCADVWECREAVAQLSRAPRAFVAFAWAPAFRYCYGCRADQPAEPDADFVMLRTFAPPFADGHQIRQETARRASARARGAERAVAPGVWLALVGAGGGGLLVVVVTLTVALRRWRTRRQGRASSEGPSSETMMDDEISARCLCVVARVARI
jgi:hypothetical protein